MFGIFVTESINGLLFCLLGLESGHSNNYNVFFFPKQVEHDVEAQSVKRLMLKSHPLSKIPSQTQTCLHGSPLHFS